MSESLGKKQERFSRAYWQLLGYAHSRGYGVRQGEGLRTKEQSEWYSQRGLGIVNSVHRLKLAHDIYLSVDGELLWDGFPYRDCGEFWCSLGDDHRWGGNMLRRDVYHFSFLHKGRY